MHTMTFPAIELPDSKTGNSWPFGQISRVLVLTAEITFVAVVVYAVVTNVF